MKLFYKYIIAFVLGIIFLEGCKQEEVVPYDNPFVYITDKYNGTSATMDSQAKYTSSYYVKLSSKTRESDLVLYYTVITGNGLVNGVDYTLDETTGDSIVFEPGKYEKEIQVNWLRHTVDDNNDNSLTIKLISTNDGKVVIGKPGPDKIGAMYTITKQ